MNTQIEATLRDASNTNDLGRCFLFSRDGTTLLEIRRAKLAGQLVSALVGDRGRIKALIASLEAESGPVLYGQVSETAAAVQLKNGTVVAIFIARKADDLELYNMCLEPKEQLDRIS